ncbi:MAG: hypothetical protein IJO52_10070, partial [Clostridia bacterium]|nr:hypothetical protein [Clostridia bacterium]
MSISVKTSLPIQVYRVDYASVTNAANDYMERGYVGNDPGLYPNPLMPRSAVPELCTLSGENKYEKGEMYRLDADPNFRSLWVSINPYSAHIESGIYDIEIELISLETGKTLEKESFTLEVADA